MKKLLKKFEIYLFGPDHEGALLLATTGIIIVIVIIALDFFGIINLVN